MDMVTFDGRESTKQQRVKVLNSDDTKISLLPENYLANTNKEELCLEYVRNFDGRFKVLHPHKPPLFLIAPNEYGVDKFVCTSLRPALLPFKEVYNLQDACSFVADYLHYEPLESPTSPPSCLPSSTQVLEWSTGDCFDVSMLLCSLLLGAGYDAYVVMGKAPKWVTLKDRAHLECPSVAAQREAEAEAVAQAKAATELDLSAKPTKYLQPAKASLESKFLAEAEADAKAGSTAIVGHANQHKHSHRHHTHADAKQLPVDDWLPDEKLAARLAGETLAEPPPTCFEDKDPALFGKRVHAWVLVRGGKRAVDGFVLVEPSTGTCYSDPAEAPYESIEAIWNDKNFHASLQHKVPVSEMSFDVQDGTAWEMVFVDPAVLLAEKEALREAMEDELENGEPMSPGSQASGDGSWASGGGAMSEEQGGGKDASPGGPQPVEGGEGAARGGERTASNVSLGGQGLRSGRAKPRVDPDRNPSGLAEDDKGTNILDLPPSWVSKLRLDRLHLDLKYPPTGCRTTLYRRCKEEVFAECRQAQGCVKRVTLYLDDQAAGRMRAFEVRETYANRTDKLSRRVKHLLKGEVAEEFLPGRPEGLKRISEVVGIRREVEFYPLARQDGLWLRVEEFGRKAMERFKGRGDSLEYRSVTAHEDTSGAAKALWVLPTGGVAGGDSDLVADKMAVKFLGSSAADRAKVSFYLREGKIRTQWHLAPGKVQPREAYHYKSDAKSGGPRGSGVGETLAPGVRAQPSELEKLLAEERAVLAEVKRSQQEMNELVKLRRREEEQATTLSKVTEPLFDAAPKLRLLGGGDSSGLEHEGFELKESAPAVDYLTPFLASYQQSSATLEGFGSTGAGSGKGKPNLSKEEAVRVRDACLRSLKDRLLERANIIQNRLNDENARLSKRQATFQRNAGREADPLAEADFEKFCAEAMFTIGILEQRLVAHEESALKKYKALDEKLAKDPRLAVLQS
mmetsp:Transcript_10574/g.24612  ORF Transcript_10574/g.24612 Transcript_10574/m.24612 type:complete len:966 (+) Transcript_10574:92-2989(+)